MGRLSDYKEKIVNNPSFTLKEQVGYAAGIFGNCMGQDSIHTFADKFFREFTGITAGQMTLMGNIKTAVNLIANPIAGNLYDTPVAPDKKPPTKLALLLAPVPFAVSSMLLYIVPSGNSLLNFIWVLLFYLIFHTADAFYDLSLSTTSLRMTTNAKDRNSFYTVATLASSLGSMLPGWLIPIIVGKADDVNLQKWLYFFISLVFCILGIISMYAPYFTLNEKIRVVERPQKTKMNWDRQTISTLLHSRSFVVTQIANFFEAIRQISYTLLPYLYDDVFDRLSMKALVDVISGLLSYAGLGAVPFVTKRFSPRTVMAGGFAYTGIFYAIMGIFGLGFNLSKVRSSKYIIGILIGLAGMPNNAISAAKKVLIGDATDYMEWYSEKRYGTPIRSEGLVTAAQSILNTFYDFIKINIYNISFGKLNYKPNIVDKTTGKLTKAVQSTSTLKGIYMMFVLCGLLGNFLASISYLFDNYTGKRRETILKELDEMREVREARLKEIEETE